MEITSPPQDTQSSHLTVAKITFCLSQTSHTYQGLYAVRTALKRAAAMTYGTLPIIVSHAISLKDLER